MSPNAVKAAMKLRDESDYQCYLMLEKLLERVSTEALAKIYANAYRVSWEEAIEFIQICRRIVETRRNANTEYIEALSEDFSISEIETNA